MDGDSTDGTVGLGKEIAENDPRIRIYSEKDNGIYDAMNKAIAKAKGNYLYFLGSDDYFYDDDVFATVHKSLKQDSTDVIYGDVFSPRFEGRYDGAFDIDKLFVKNICHQAIFLHKSVFEKIGDFDLRYSAHADYLHNIKWFLHRSISHRYIDRIIAYYEDGGFSSVHGDALFSENKEGIFLKLALKNLHLKFYYQKQLKNLKARKKEFTAWLKGMKK